MDSKIYEKLQGLRRYKEPIQAVLRTVKRQDKDDPDTEYAEFALENGKIIGICKKRTSQIIHLEVLHNSQVIFLT